MEPGNITAAPLANTARSACSCTDVMAEDAAAVPLLFPATGSRVDEVHEARLVRVPLAGAVTVTV